MLANLLVERLYPPAYKQKSFTIPASLIPDSKVRMVATLADLSQGALQEVFQGRKCDDSFQPVFQILDLRKVAPSPNVQHDRYRVILSDGLHYTQGMLATGHNNLVTSGELQLQCLVKCQNLIVNNVGGRRCVWILANNFPYRTYLSPLEWWDRL